MATTYSVLYKTPEARTDGVAVDVIVSRDDGETIQGASNHRTVLLPVADVAEVKDAAALDELVRKQVEAWDVPAQDDAARKALAEAQAAKDKALTLDARLATTGRSVALAAKAIEAGQK